MTKKQKQYILDQHNLYAMLRAMNVAKGNSQKAENYDAKRLAIIELMIAFNIMFDKNVHVEQFTTSQGEPYNRYYLLGVN